MVRKGPRVGASSSSAASRTGTPAFTSFAAATAQVLQTDTASPASAPISEWETQALSLLRASSRKDATTRTRALCDLARHMPSAGAGDGRALVGAWGEQFAALAADPAAAVRVAALDANGALIAALGRATQRALRRLLPAWLAARGDATPAVVRAADDALRRVFAPAAQRKLAERVGGDVAAFAVTELHAARERGDAARAARALAAVRWVVGKAESVAQVHVLMEDGVLLAALKGAKRGGGRGVAPREVCDFVREALVYVGDGEEHVVGERCGVVFKVMCAGLQSAGAPAWDLLVAVLNMRAWPALDWEALRAAMLEGLAPKPVSAATLSSLLPVLSLLPRETALETAEAVLAAVGKGLIPRGAGADGADGAEPAGQSHGLVALHARDALPAFLECLTFSGKAVDERWDCPDPVQVRGRLCSRFLLPVLGAYLDGSLVPFMVTKRGSGEASGRGRPPVTRPGVKQSPQVFATALVAVCNESIEHVARELVSKVLPLVGAKAGTDERVAGFVKQVAECNEPCGRTLVSAFVDAVVSRRDASSVMELDWCSASLSLLCGLSHVPVLPRVALGRDGVASGVQTFALSAVQTHAEHTEVVVLAGRVLGWVHEAEITGCGEDSASSRKPFVLCEVCTASWMSASSKAALLAALLESSQEIFCQFLRKDVDCGSNEVQTASVEAHGKDNRDFSAFVEEVVEAVARETADAPENSLTDFLFVAMRPYSRSPLSSHVLRRVFGVFSTYFAASGFPQWAQKLFDLLSLHIESSEPDLKDASYGLLSVAVASISPDSPGFKAIVSALAKIPNRFGFEMETRIVTAVGDAALKGLDKEDHLVISASTSEEALCSLGNALGAALLALWPNVQQHISVYRRASKQLCQHVQRDRWWRPCNALLVGLAVRFNLYGTLALSAESSESEEIAGHTLAEYSRIMFLLDWSSKHISAVRDAFRDSVSAAVRKARGSGPSSSGSEHYLSALCEACVYRVSSTETCFVDEVCGTLSGSSDVLVRLQQSQNVGQIAFKSFMISVLKEIVDGEMQSDIRRSGSLTVAFILKAIGTTLSAATPQLVALCSQVCRDFDLKPMHGLIKSCVLTVRRNPDKEEALFALDVLIAAWPSKSCSHGEDHVSNDIPEFLAESTTIALRAIRQGAVAAQLGSETRNLVPRGASLLAKAIHGGLSPSEDNVRFWTFAALDTFREAQVIDVDAVSVSILQSFVWDFCAMASVAASICDQDPSGFVDFSEAQVADMAMRENDLIRNGAIGVARLLPTLLRLLPFSSCQAAVGLVLDAMEPGLVDCDCLELDAAEADRLVSLLGHREESVRHASLMILGAVMPRLLETRLCEELPRSEDCNEDATRVLTERRLFSRPLLDMLVWPSGASIEEASLPELGYFLAWLLLLEIARHDKAGSSSTSERVLEDWSCRRLVVDLLRAEPELVGSLFSNCVDVVIDGNRDEKDAANIAAGEMPEDLTVWVKNGAYPLRAPGLSYHVGRSSGSVLAAALHRLPALSRHCVTDDIDHSAADHLKEFVKRRVSPLLISEEIRKVKEWRKSPEVLVGDGGVDSEGELSTRGSVAAREVCATYVLYDVSLQIVLRLPEAFPLQLVEVDDSETGSSCATGLGRGLWHKTLRGMNTLLRFKDGSIAEAIELWRQNLDKRLGGIEDCPVCYSVLHLTTAELPKMQCRTCKNTFHAPCLYKWFTKSGSRSCPMCRSVF